jgi:hypothetical protein
VPKAFWMPPNLQPRESEIVDAVFQSEKSIEVSLWKAASYAISTRKSFLTYGDALAQVAPERLGAGHVPDVRCLQVLEPFQAVGVDR